MVSEAFALPADHRPRLHDDEGLSPPGPGSREPRPEDTVGWSQLRASPGSLVDRELVAQREDFDLQRQAGADHGSEACHHRYHHGLHGCPPYRSWRAYSIPCARPATAIEITPENSR